MVTVTKYLTYRANDTVLKVVNRQLILSITT